MPDKWGRITGDDLMGVAGSIDTIQRMGQRNTLFKQGQQDRQKEETSLLNKRANYKLLNENGLDAELTAGTPEDKITAKQWKAEEGKAQSLLKSQADTSEYEKSLGSLISWKQENPDMDWEKAPINLYPGVNGQKAYVNAIKLGAETAEGKQRTQAAIQQLGERTFPIFQSQQQLAIQSLQSGDLDTTVNVLQKMSRELPIPYQLGEFDAKTQTFDVQYLDSKSGKFQSTGKKSLKEVMGQINATGEKEYVNQIALHAMAIDEGNRTNRQKPMLGKNASGESFLIIPQKQWANPNQVEIEARNEKTNEKTIFPSWEALQSFGINVVNLDDEKKRADIESTEVLTDTRREILKNANDGELKPTPANLKYAEEKAFNTISMNLKAEGVDFNEEEKYVLIPSDKNGKPEDINLLKMIDQSGFAFKTGKPVETESNIFSKDKYAVPVYIGNYNAKQSGEQEIQQETSQETPANNTQRPPLSSIFSGEKETAAPKQQPKTESKSGKIEPIGEVDGKKIARSNKGYVIEDNGEWREPTKAEQAKITLLARKGRFTTEGGWKYKNKVPNKLTSPESTGRDGQPRLTKSNRM